ncbi:MAG: TetR/AcrR family transcriptional regulator [Burkholderiaceae bacterium]
MTTRTRTKTTADAVAGDDPPPRRRTRSPQTRRAALMDAAEALFLSKGVAATSVEDIAGAAQVAKGTFYLYFTSRDAMLDALQQRFMQTYCERIEQAMARCRPDDWNARLRNWCKTSLDGLLEQVMLHDMLFHDVRPDDRGFMMRNPVITQLAELLRAGARAGAWQVSDARGLAVMMFHSMHGLADDAVAHGTAERRAPLVRLLVRTFTRALGSAEPARDAERP